MSLAAFVDINFADPVLSLDANQNGLVYGTALGRLVYFDFEASETLLLSERSEEPIRGVSIDEGGTIYAAVGDLKGMILSSYENHYAFQRDISHDQPHTPAFCTNTQVLMHLDSICLMHPESEQELITLVARPTASALYVTQLNSLRRIAYGSIKFTSFSVPFDYDSHRLLWLECMLDRSKALNLFSFSTERISVIMQIPRKTRITYAKLVESFIVFIEDGRAIKVLEIGSPTAPVILGHTVSDIMTSCCSLKAQTVKST
mmetsp:Transcript_832/g.1863  ORF Transcript_832/g.1863 Transcript_832/m.1863 type:complete len:260 (+) Transcript_832:4145-4924(+)